LIVVSRPDQFNIGLLAQQVQCSVAVLAANPRKQNSCELSVGEREFIEKIALAY
jgi:hypothetical protein